MVRLVVSPDIRKIISEYNTEEQLSENDDGYINPYSLSIDHPELAHMAEVLQAKAAPNQCLRYSLSTMLKTTSLYLEAPAKPDPVRAVPW